MVKDQIYTIKKERQGVDLYHLIDAQGCMTRCGHYSAWGSSIRGNTTGVDFYLLSVADTSGKLCAQCLRGAPVDTQQTWDRDTPLHKRRGVCVDDFKSLLTWLKEERRATISSHQ